MKPQIGSVPNEAASVKPQIGSVPNEAASVKPQIGSVPNEAASEKRQIIVTGVGDTGLRVIVAGNDAPARDAALRSSLCAKTSEVTMASERPADDDDGRAESIPAAALRSALQRQLIRHLDAPSAPAITVFGFAKDQSRVLRIGIDRPEDAVLGLILPSRYSAIGVLAASVVATPPQRGHRDAALALGVTRSGQTVSMLAPATEAVMVTSRPQGWLIDACRRAVGLRTPPCPAAALTFPIALWLDRVMVALLNEPQRLLTWGDVVGMCPVPGRWRSLDPIDLGATLGSTTSSWSALRQATARGHRNLIGLRRHHAEWMDDAMFARWCLGSFPELASLRSDVEFLAPQEVAECIDLALRAAWSAFG